MTPWPLKQETDELWAEVLIKRRVHEYAATLGALSRIITLTTDALAAHQDWIGSYSAAYIRDSAYICQGFIYRDLGDVPAAIYSADFMLDLGIGSKAKAYFHRAAISSASGLFEVSARDRQRFLDLAISEKWCGPWEALSLYWGMSQQDLARLAEDFSPSRASKVSEAATSFFCRAVCRGNYRVDRGGAYADYCDAFTLAPENPALRFWKTRIDNQFEIYSCHLTSRDTDKMCPEVEYCNVTCSFPGQGNSKVGVYNFGADQPVERSVRNETLTAVLSDLESQGWKQKASAWLPNSPTEDYVYYYQRKKNQHQHHDQRETIKTYSSATIG
jgi:hypothetical protein